MTAHAEAPRRRAPDQIKEMKLRPHPKVMDALRVLCADPKTTVVIMSGSERAVLDEVGAATAAAAAAAAGWSRWGGGGGGGSRFWI